METFNIHIEHQQQPLTLTVDKKAGQFRLIYNGGFIGAVKAAGDDWEWVTEDEMEASDLPLLSTKKGLLNEQIELSSLDINHITAEIENHIHASG